MRGAWRGAWGRDRVEGGGVTNAPQTRINSSSVSCMSKYLV